MKDKAKLVIQSIRSGRNSDALKYLYQDPLRKIRKFILNNSGNLDDADDIFQDTVVVLFHYVKTGKYNEDFDLDGFLFRVAKNSWVDQARKKNKVIQEEFSGFDLSDGSDSLIEMIKEEKLTIFHALFNKLEENCKRILTLSVFDKKSMKEISSIMGFKDENVAKNQHYRCKKYFASLVTQDQETLKILKG